MRRFLFAIVILALAPWQADAIDEETVKRLERFRDKLGETVLQADQIRETLFLEDAPTLHVEAMFRACGEPFPAPDIGSIIRKVALLHEELFGVDDDALLRAVIEYLAHRTGYVSGYENALRAAFRGGLGRDWLCDYARERADQLGLR